MLNATLQDCRVVDGTVQLTHLQRTVHLALLGKLYFVTCYNLSLLTAKEYPHIHLLLIVFQNCTQMAIA